MKLDRTLAALIAAFLTCVPVGATLAFPGLSHAAIVILALLVAVAVAAIVLRPTGKSGPVPDPALARFQAARLAAMAHTLSRTSHDLRGILSPALLMSERLLASTEPNVRRAGEVVVRAVERATELLQTTLELARDGAKPVRTRIALRDLVGEAAGNLPVTHSFTDDELANSDPAQVGEAFADLFRDAAARGARSITVARDRSSEDMILVTDDGAALSLQCAAQAFKPDAGAEPPGYFRAIARELIRAQGGDVTLDGTTPGSTAYRLTLPGLVRRRPSAAA